jgi:hypothetical protein
LFLALVALSLGITYEDYSVVRFFGLNDTDVFSFYDANLDVWGTNKIESWAEVMIHKDQLKQYLDLYPQYKIVFDNVQTLLDRSSEENERARAAAAGRPFEFDYFPTYQEVYDWLLKLEQENAAFATRVSIGYTFQNREIQGIQLSSGGGDLPLIFLQCTIHAREWITTTTCCHIIEQLLTKDTNLLQYFNWVIVPVLNVDGYHFTHTDTRLWRKNRQPNTGSTCIGTDLNRNYEVGWGGPGSGSNPCGDTYRGPEPFSGPETAASTRFINNWVGRKAAFVDIHCSGAMFMSPWGDTTTLPPAQDYAQMDRIMVAATNGIRSVNGRSYAYGSIANVIYLASGGASDYTYGDPNLKIIPSFSIECWSSAGFTPPPSEILPVASEIYAGIKALAANV